MSRQFRLLPLLCALAAVAGTANAAELPPRVRFASEPASAEIRQRMDRYVEEAGLRRAPADRKPPSGPIVIEKAGGRRQRADLDGRFIQLMEVGADGAAACGEPGGRAFAPAAADPPLATISRNPDHLEGADAEGRILLYTPEPVEIGSSVSHWDRRANPNLLMEPALSPGPGAPRLDLTPAVMEDVGWHLGTAPVTLVSTDLPGIGLNDPRPFAGAPGNPATTLGAARRAVLEAAFTTWAETLHSDVPIVALVRFSELFCQPNVGAILAGAGPLSAWANLENPEAFDNTWYPAALAEALAGEDLTGPPSASGGGDISVMVNGFLDEGCLGPDRGWYYGLDNQAPATRSDLYAVLLHELAHGLGMLTFTGADSGAQLGPWPTIYDRFLYDPVLGKTWPQMDNEERAWSARRHGRLAWNGTHVKAAAPSHLAAGRVELHVGSGSAAGEYPTVPAKFGLVSTTPLTAPLACAQDLLAPTADACSPIAAGSLAGKIALVERGNCDPEVKARNVQQAGAAGMVLVNLAGDTQLFQVAVGAAGDITIPVIAVGRSAGARLETAACPGQAPPLAGGRFDIRAVWFVGRESGNAQITRLTADSVYATFFGSDNPELVIKVLDGCATPGGNFWVFAAGLTNVGVDWAVTDTWTGLSRGYFNPPDAGFQPVFDTSAFACPRVP